jgi:hypothetical protein
LPEVREPAVAAFLAHSVVSEEVFQVFVSALGGTAPALTTENMNDLRLFCEGFGFAALCSNVSVVDEEARWWG